MSAEEDERREQIAFMVDAILRTVNNLKENFHMYESATRQVLSIAREGMAQPTQVVEPPVQPVNGRSALSTVKVDRKRLASKGSVTSLGSKHLKAATLLVTLFAVFNQTNALAAIKSAPIKVLPKNKKWGRTMAKMVGICLESPLGGSPNLNTILLDPLQNVSTLQGKKGLVCREATGLIALWSLDPKP